MMLTLTLPGVPPSVNHLYSHVAGGGKHRTPAAVAWQTAAALYIAHAARQAGFVLPPQTPWALRLTVTAPRVWTFDLDNKLKALVDSIAQGLGADDRYLQTLRATKSQGPEAGTIITVTLGEIA